MVLNQNLPFLLFNLLCSMQSNSSTAGGHRWVTASSLPRFFTILWKSQEWEPFPRLHHGVFTCDSFFLFKYNPVKSHLTTSFLTLPPGSLGSQGGESCSDLSGPLLRRMPRAQETQSSWQCHSRGHLSMSNHICICNETTGSLRGPFPREESKEGP